MTRGISAILFAAALMIAGPASAGTGEQPAPAATSADQQGAAKAGGGEERSDTPDSRPAAATEAETPDQRDEKKDDSGLKFSLQEQSEVWANAAGGGKRGTSYNGLTTATLDIDLEKLVGLRKGRFFASAFDIHGHGPSRSLVGNNQLISNIEAAPSLKLYDLWFEERFFGKLYVRVGQEGANDEMMTTAYGAVFLNSSFGFPGLPAADLPSGGPNYPMATPFVRARWKALDRLTIVGAVYNGDPAPPGPGDPQVRNRNGTAFRTDGNALAFTELRYQPHPDAPDNFTTTYKLGAWYHSGRFLDQRFDNTGMLLADPAGSGTARMHRGDFAVYGIVDQVLWRREGTKDQGIAAFLQVQAGPSDRNLVDLFVEGGFNWNAPFPDRGSDVAGLAFSHIGISPAARRFSRDLVAFGRGGAPYAGHETVIEATYKAPITDWLTLQPDVQYVVNPNAGIPGVFTRAPLRNALILGLRTTVKLGN